MEPRTIRLNFDLSFVYGPRTFRVPLAAVMMLAAVGELNSESVTLSTYYPAPSGVYTNMITTDNTYLARDGGAASRVGVGTTSPGAKLSVAGSMAVGSYAGNVPPANALIVGGRVGVGLTNPAQALDVVGNVNVASGGGGRGYIKLNATGCTISAAVANGSICPAGRYATFQPGVYTEGTSYNNLPAPFLVTPNLTRIYQFVGINPATGQQSAMSTGYTEAVRVACCLK